MSDAKSGKKPQKLKARMPRGLADRGPAEIAATRAMVETIRTTFERYGFDPVETPTFEYTDALGKFLPDQDRPNEGVFSFQDDDEQWISLRYDLTAPLARYVAENYQHLALPYRSYRNGYVYRNEKPGPGRFRQFMQFDADTVGSASMAADAEMCMLAADTMEALGIKRGDYVVKVNNRKVLDGVMDGAEIPADKRLTVLRAIDKLDRLGLDGVRQLLGAGRKDESGDFTKGAELADSQIELVQSLWMPLTGSFVKLGQSTFATSTDSDAGQSRDMEQAGPFEYIDNLKTLEAWEQMFAKSPVSLQAIAELKEIVRTFEAAGFGSKRVRVDSSVVRGLEYYTGPVYEVELTFDTLDDKGRPVRFGSVGGGGRYDGLVSRFMGQPVPATGFSIGVSRLQAALEKLGTLSTKPVPGPVLVTVMGGNIADYQRLVSTLRNSKLDPDNPNSPNIRAELYLGNPKHGIGQQLKYADKRSSPCAIIQGSDEKAKGQVVIKDLILGAELAAETATDREDYLKKQAEAQFSVNEADLVAEVRKVLARRKA
ncbi:MAG: histidine--tRNA ligase [Pseudolabrys sp.]|jgi:histidyl-tRNA synthetase